MMPHLDGFGLLRAIRDDAALAGTPVILLSARAGEESRVEGLEADADDYLIKPFAARELLARVAAHVKMSNLRRETAEREERMRSEAELEREKSRASEERLAETSRLYRELQQADAELQLQVALLQQLPVSAWTLNPDGTPDFVNRVWLEFAGQTLDSIRSHPEAWMTAVHPEDREMAAKAFWEGVHSGQGFAFETRSLRAQDGTYRWHLQQAVVLRDAEGKVLKFVGTTTDIDEQKRTGEALRQAQGDLARINRATTMGELAASLGHELSQPISGAITNANVGLRTLRKDNPNLDEVRGVFARIVRDAHRAAEIVARIRSQFEKGSVNRETLDVGEVIRETVALLHGEAMRHSISVRMELATSLPQIVGDRVQLQQVAMNLIVNSIEAMKDVDGIRELIIMSQRAENEQILVSVSDTGPGFPPQLAEQIFDPFFTTKPHGTGMGLRISRSIIESHGGRLWAVGSAGRGATFHLNLPTAIPGNR
jgi:PAS domain S-box-containing protein